jgi:hypothetical protein
VVDLGPARIGTTPLTVLVLATDHPDPATTGTQEVAQLTTS